MVQPSRSIRGSSRCRASRIYRAFTKIILAAEARAKELGRPVFLFTYDGKIETGRC